MREPRARRVLVAAFGSAGDLFPLVPAILRLRRDGHDVRGAAPRALGVYLRALGVPALALGDGREVRVFEDDDVVTTRFDGWASWRRTATAYVAPTLARDVAALRRVIGRWRPHAVAATSFAPAARVAAVAEGVPLVSLSIYPQHQRYLARDRSFAGPLRRAIADLVGLAAGDDRVTQLAWGAGRGTTLVHDPVLLAAAGEEAAGEAVGFPSWDGGPSRPGDLARIETWLAESPGPAVLVTLGSFLGSRQRAAWAEAARAADDLGLRAVFVGPRAGWGADVFGDRTGVLTVGFVPLSRVVHRVDAVVHHGGIGTTVAALRAGRPAVVVPQAFDQPCNARLVERAGVGLDGARHGVRAALERLLKDESSAACARQLAGRLVAADAAAARVADRMLEAAHGEDGT